MHTFIERLLVEALSFEALKRLVEALRRLVIDLAVLVRSSTLICARGFPNPASVH